MITVQNFIFFLGLRLSKNSSVNGVNRDYKRFTRYNSFNKMKLRSKRDRIKMHVFSFELKNDLRAIILLKKNLGEFENVTECLSKKLFI